MTRTRALAAALLAACLAGALLAAPATPDAAAAAAKRPNVVLIFADDMRLDDLAYMPRTRRLFKRHGLRFTNAISPHPLCCPARAELMTGQYAQNNGVHHNIGPWGGYHSMTDHSELTPKWFRRAGYRTAYVGKYMNRYKGGRVNGTHVTDTLVKRIYAARRFTTWNNGKPRRRPGHQTEWTARRTDQLIRRYAGRPFFVMTSYVAPHGMRQQGRWVPPIPPPGFDTVRPRHTRPPSLDAASYNEQDVSDKPAAIQARSPVSDDNIQHQHERRVRSLYALDQAVMGTVRTLKKAGVFDNTVLAFTSDNGFALGEHRMTGKNLPYAEVMRVPLLMTGPGIPVGTDDQLATLVDVPATLAALGGVTPGREQDGVDLFTPRPDRAVLVQAGSSTEQWSWRGVFTGRYTYVEHETGEVEMYDRVEDPAELESVHSRPAYQVARTDLARLYSGLASCAGAGCQATWRAPAGGS